MLSPSRAACKVLRSQTTSTVLRNAQRRELLTLAIESSCDDSSVAIVEKHESKAPFCSTATVHFLENVTADSREYRGIHPMIALGSHQRNLASLIHKSLLHLPQASERDSNEGSIHISSTDGRVTRRKPDFISVTRGPGMASSLATGLDTAKGLAVAWQIPLVGVHHMQAHLLTPRLVAALDAQAAAVSKSKGVEFPFLSLLVSGGHTLLVHSRSLVDHEILASTVDIAIGDALDKIARIVLPTSHLEQSKTTMYGKSLEAFVFPNGKADFADYRAPSSRREEIAKYEDTKWGWSFSMPYGETRKLAFSFAGSLSEAHKQVANRQATWKETPSQGAEEWFPHDARVALGREFMRVCFEHLASRTVIALQNLQQPPGTEPWNKTDRKKNEKNPALLKDPVKTLVVSGGVAANQFLRSLLRSFLDIRGFGDVEIVAPPMYLCTDNAAMIGWTGLEMFEAGWKSDLKCRAMRKWALDAKADDGGILGPDDWVKFR
ncbi:Mitochondrial tRNAs modification protein [Emydomyces testavorans]|uniref:Mitochondrial tRNAs modification protein n=1 Tax=Emydomyces testavorans TaxID=2070801 RepID=A0AAF0ILH1_9EURO|nr:Mitochondrial tRNAs modification protein [Emydomyces testavorans]